MPQSHRSASRARYAPLVAALCLTAAAVLGSCGPSIYRLPEPDERQVREETQRLRDAASAEDEARRYIAARRAVLAFIDAIREARWRDAYMRLSNETRLLVDNYATGLGEDALRDGRFVIDGVTYAFDPLDLFVVTELSNFSDSMQGVEENETPRRKEIFAVGTDGTARRIVLIREGDEWLIHTPRLPRERLRPAVPPEGS